PRGPRRGRDVRRRWRRRRRGRDPRLRLRGLYLLADVGALLAGLLRQLGLGLVGKHLVARLERFVVELELVQGGAEVEVVARVGGDGDRLAKLGRRPLVVLLFGVKVLPLVVQRLRLLVLGERGRGKQKQGDGHGEAMHSVSMGRRESSSMVPCVRRAAWAARAKTRPSSRSLVASRTSRSPRRRAWSSSTATTSGASTTSTSRRSSSADRPNATSRWIRSRCRATTPRSSTPARPFSFATWGRPTAPTSTTSSS